MILSNRQILFCLFLSTIAQIKSAIIQVPPKRVIQLKINDLISLYLKTSVSFNEYGLLVSWATILNNQKTNATFTWMK